MAITQGIFLVLSDIQFLLSQLRLPGNTPLLPIDATGIRDTQGVGNNINNPTWGNADQLFTRDTYNAFTFNTTLAQALATQAATGSPNLGLYTQTIGATRVRVAQLESTLFAGRTGSFNAADEAAQLVGYRRECGAEGEAERATFAARAAMDRARADYLEAHRKLEVVKRLEVKARTDHRLAAGREEQNEFDDYAGRMASRRSTSSGLGRAPLHSS